jgi:hypothetical protein
MNSQGSMIVYILSSVSGMVVWKDYIPVRDFTVADVGRTDDDGAIKVEVLSDVTGKKAWRDYIPVWEQ